MLQVANVAYIETQKRATGIVFCRVSCSIMICVCIVYCIAIPYKLNLFSTIF